MKHKPLTELDIDEIGTQPSKQTEKELNLISKYIKKQKQRKKKLWKNILKPKKNI